MKKALSAVLAVVLVLGVCFSVPMIASANDANDFTYRLNEDGDGYIITGVKNVNNVTGEVTIPKEYTLKSGEGFDEDGNVITITNPTNALADSDAGNGTDNGDSTQPVEKVKPVITLGLADEIEVGKSTEFTVKTEANGYEGTIVYGDGGLSVPDAIEKLEYYEVRDGQWHDLPTNTNFGGSEGFELADAEAKFRVTFKTTGTYKANFIVKVVETNEVLAEAEKSIVVKEPSKYNVRLDDVDKGIGLHLDKDANPAKAGQTVNVYITADLEKYIVSGIKVTYGENQTVQATKIDVPDGNNAIVDAYSFVMPASEVKVEPVFAYVYNAINVATLTNGSIEIEGTKNAEDKYENNKSVTLTVKPAKGFKLSKLTVDNEVVAVNKDGEYTFTMPAKEVAVSAEFVVATLPVVGIDEGAFAGCTGITSFKLTEGQTNFVVTEGVLFEKVTTTTPAATEGGEATTTTTLKLIAFPDAYVATNEAKTYTIPATVDTLAVTEVANGAFQALGNVEYVFCADEDITLFDKHPAFYTTEGEGAEATKVNNKKLHLGMTTHTKAATGVITVEPNCTNKGIKTFYCAVCGEDTIIEEVVVDVVAGAHVLGDWYTVSDADCIEDGEKAKDCILCKTKKVETDDIPALGHTEPADWDVTEAKCGVQGVKIKACTVCGAELDKVTLPALTHEITDNKGNENIISKTEATCTKDGSVTGNCDHCGNVVTLTIKAKGHENIRVVDAEPTCTVNGWEHYECKNCGEFLKGSDMELTAPGHVAASVKDENDNFVDYKWTVVKAPTCSEDGFAEVRCENCGIQMVDPEGEIEYTRVLPKTGKHDFKDYTETKAATCEEAGSKTGTCACGATDVAEIDALGHDIKDVEFTIDTEATCKDNGSKSKHCKRCDKKLEVTVITEKGPHKLKEGATETTKATCHNTGLYTGECTVCGDKAATVVIPALDHTWDAEAVNLKTSIQLVVDKVDEDGNVVLGDDKKPVKETITASAPTCTADGYKAIYCKNEGCSAYKEDSVVKVVALGHNPVAYPTDKTPSVKVNATCTSEGTDYRYCDRCKDEYSFKIPKLQHDWKTEAEVLRETIKIQVEQKDETGKVILGKDGKPVMVEADASKPTCNDPGYTAIYCNTCATYKDVTAVEALGHDALYKDWTLDTSKPATCTKKATETNECSRCGDEMRQDTGDFAACVFETTYTFEYPTCEEAGRKYYKCSNPACDKINGEEVLPALGHKFAPDAEFVGTDATCEKDGVKVKECLNCFEIGTGKPYVEPATGDSTGGTEQSGTTPNPVAEGDATTGTGGNTTPATRPAAPAGYKYCEGYKVVTPATGHAFSDEYTEDLAATCEVPGKESRHCTNKDCNVTTGERAIAKLGHNYSDEYKTVEAATCKAEGKEARYCLNEGCKSYTGERKLAKADHTYNDRTWKTVVGKAATCEATGTEYNNCTVCNEYTEREAKALGHKWAETWTIVDADCVNKGQSYKACERAGCTAKSELEETPALGHKLDSTADDYDAQDATCTKAGYKKGTCTVCNTFVTIDEVEKIGHKFSAENTKVDATCQTAGSITGKCQNEDCDGTEDAYGNVTEIIPAKEHSFTKYVLVKDKLCTEDNALVSVCDTCKEDAEKGLVKATKYKKNDKHTESGWILDADATCSTNGKMHTECTVCKFEMNKQTLYATDAHEYEEDTTKRVEPTCIEPGSKTLVCKNCEGKKVEEIAPTDHTFTDWKVFVEPTCTEKGIRQSVCTVCLTTKSEKILANGHTESDWIVTEPTCTKTGEKHTECTVCKEVIQTKTIAALGHNYTTSNTCSAEGCEAKLYEYKLIGESTTDIEITKYNPDSKNVVKNVVIPSEIDGYVVKAIGDRAFMNIEVVPGAVIDEETGERAQDTTRCVKSAIETVTIPETVTTIGAYAFASASDNFKSVVIPGTVTTIGDYAFGYNATITWEKAEAKEGEKVEDLPLVEKISAKTVNTEDFTFAIYGVKDSAAAVYAAQDPEKDNDDFKFAAIADIYEVAIPKGAEAEKSGDNVVLFKEFAVKNADGTKAPEIDEQIAAVIDINVSGYSVEVVSSQSYEPVDKDGNVIEKDCKYFYGTGTKVLVKEGNNVVDVIEIAVQGDVNGDGVCDAIDCMLIQLAAQKQKTLDGVYYTAGNITSDTAIDANDFSAAVLKIFGEDHIVGTKEETTTPSTSAPTTTEPTTEAPAESTTQAPAESTTQAPVESTTQAPAESTTQTSGEAA